MILNQLRVVIAGARSLRVICEYSLFRSSEKLRLGRVIMIGNLLLRQVHAA
jgi:hypothetical protein